MVLSEIISIIQYTEYKMKENAAGIISISGHAAQMYKEAV